MPTSLSQASGLTESQIQSIIGLLRSFGADQATIDNVNTSLRGGTPSLKIENSKLKILTGPFSYGTRSEQVKILQQMLNVSPTGYYGPLTRQAVINFQKKNGILQTGLAGPITRKKLNELYAK